MYTRVIPHISHRWLSQKWTFIIFWVTKIKRVSTIVPIDPSHYIDMYASRFLILCLHTLLIGKCTKLIACAEAVTFAMKISVAIGEQKFN